MKNQTFQTHGSKGRTSCTSSSKLTEHSTTAVALESLTLARELLRLNFFFLSGILIEGLSPEEQIPIIEKRQLLLREIHANAKREIALLEKQRKAHKDKKREERDKERQLAKEGLSSSASSSIVA